MLRQRHWRPVALGAARGRITVVPPAYRATRAGCGAAGAIVGSESQSGLDRGGQRPGYWDIAEARRHARYRRLGPPAARRGPRCSLTRQALEAPALRDATQRKHELLAWSQLGA